MHVFTLRSGQPKKIIGLKLLWRSNAGTGVLTLSRKNEGRLYEPAITLMPSWYLFFSQGVQLDAPACNFETWAIHIGDVRWHSTSEPRYPRNIARVWLASIVWDPLSCVVYEKPSPTNIIDLPQTQWMGLVWCLLVHLLPFYVLFTRVGHGWTKLCGSESMTWIKGEMKWATVLTPDLVLTNLRWCPRDEECRRLEALLYKVQN